MLNFNHGSKVWIKSYEYLEIPPIGFHLPWWPKFNKILGGLRTHEISLICAPTGAGKTQWLASVATQLMLMKIATFVAPVETGDADFIIRMIENAEGIEINDGEPKTKEQVIELRKKYDPSFERAPIFISTHDNRVDIEEMALTLKFMSQAHGVKVALLDNLNFFLNVTSSTMEKAEMDSAIHEFVMLIKKLPMHIILVVHPKKTERGRVENEFDIKGSSTAVQECSNVILFNRPHYDDIESNKRTSFDREMVFRKIRKKGSNVGIPIWFKFNKGRYEEII